MKKFIVFTFNTDMEEVIEDLGGYEQFDAILEVNAYNRLKPYAQIVFETTNQEEAEKEALNFFAKHKSDVFIYDLESNRIYN